MTVFDGVKNLQCVTITMHAPGEHGVDAQVAGHFRCLIALPRNTATFDREIRNIVQRLHEFILEPGYEVVVGRIQACVLERHYADGLEVRWWNLRPDYPRDESDNDGRRNRLPARRRNGRVRGQCCFGLRRVHELDRLHQAIAAPRQRLDILMWARLVAEMAAQLRQATIDRLIARRSPIPEFVDKLVTRNEIAVALGKCDQDTENARFGTFFLVATAQHATEW